MEADRTAVMEVIRPLLLSPQSDQLAQDIAAAIEAVCQMAKTDRMRQHALQEELARQSAKAAAAERERAELEARVRQLQAACEANHTDKARLQWLEQELEVQAQKAARTEAALQDRAVLEDRIQLLQAAVEQQNSRHDEVRAALLQQWELERARLQRKVEHFNFEVLAKQREVDRLRQQLQLQQERRSGLGADTRSDSQCSMQQARTGNAGRDFRCGEGLQFSSGGREPPTPSRMPDAHPYGLQASQLRHSSVVPHIDWEISLGGQDNTQRSWHGAAPTTGGRGASVQETPGWHSFIPGSQKQGCRSDSSRQPHCEQHLGSSRHGVAQQQSVAAAGTSPAAPAAAAGAAAGNKPSVPERGGRGDIRDSSTLAAHHDEMQAFLSAAAAVAGPDVSAWIARELAEQGGATTNQPGAAGHSRTAMRPTIQTPPTPRKEGQCYSTDKGQPRSSSNSALFSQQGQQAGLQGNAGGAWEAARAAGQPRQQQQHDCNAGWHGHGAADSHHQTNNNNNHTTTSSRAPFMAAAAAAGETPRHSGGWQHTILQTAADPASYA